MPNNKRLIAENIDNLCQVAVLPKKKVAFMCGACVFTKNVNFLHFTHAYTGHIDVMMKEKEGAHLLEHEPLNESLSNPVCSIQRVESQLLCVFSCRINLTNMRFVPTK